MLNEGEAIDNVAKSVGIISDETLIANHPWVTNVDNELERIQAQKDKEQEQYGLAFNPAMNEGAGDE